MNQRCFLMVILAASIVTIMAGSAQAARRETGSQELAALRHAYAILAVADHDYDGHRHKAMEAIAAACKHMGGAIEGDGKGHEPQGESDGQMRKARQILEEIKGSAHGHVAKHIEHALKEIEIGLTKR